MTQVKSTNRPSPQWDEEYDKRFGAETSRILDSLQGDMQRVVNAVNNSNQTAVDADTTPSVKKCGRHGILTLSNTGATSVTTLDDGENLQVVTLVATTANTTLVHSASFRLSGSANRVMAANDALTLILDSTVWREIARTNA